MDKNNIKALVNALGNDKDQLIKLKESAVKVKEYELAATLRDYINENFPVTQESIIANEEARKLETVLRMVGISIDKRTAWIANETLIKYRRRKDNFSTKDVVEIQSRYTKIFGNG